VKIESKNQSNDSMELESLELMGIFLAVFGSIVAASAVIPDDWTGRLANLAAGGLLLVIGVSSLLRGRAQRKC
jgi:hypothetical protein